MSPTRTATVGIGFIVTGVKMYFIKVFLHFNFTLNKIDSRYKVHSLIFILSNLVWMLNLLKS